MKSVVNGLLAGMTVGLALAGPIPIWGVVIAWAFSTWAGIYLQS